MDGGKIIQPGASALAALPDFRIGDALIRPSLREVEGQGGVATVEPKVMQVLLALADAGGAVVSREALMGRCWPNQSVGDDALGRAIFEVRRAIRTAAVVGFAVETIPKTGYRLVTRAADAAPGSIDAAAGDAPGAPRRARRAVLAGGAVLIAAGVFAAFRLEPGPKRRRAEALVERATVALREGNSFGEVDPVAMLKEATRLAPTSADAWGKLALALKEVADTRGRFEQGAADAQIAARRALELEPRQPDALLALATVKPLFGDWFDADQRLTALAAGQPGHEPTLDALAWFQASVGREQASEALRARLVKMNPTSPIYAFKQIMSLWIVGRVAEMDAVAANARRLWPNHPAFAFGHAFTLAWTGRAAEAVALTEAWKGPLGVADERAMTLAAYRALAGQIPAAEAVATIKAAARRAPDLLHDAIPSLSGLGAVDDAFDLARGYLLRTGPWTPPEWNASGDAMPRQFRERATNMLFSPPCARMRADPRFTGLLRDIDLLDYWRASGRRPDFLGGRPLPA